MNIVDLKEAIEASKKLMMFGSSLLNYGDERNYAKYSKSYFTTTENIRKYMERLQLNEGRALSVLASGDQTFNLIYKGIKNIDTFDVNYLTYFIFNLRRAMFLGLDKKDALRAHKFFGISGHLEESLEILEKIKSYMPSEVYSYYKELLEFALASGIFDLRNLFENRTKNLQNYNLYLDSKEAYLQLQKGLDVANVEFNFGDAKDIISKINRDYEVIILSNIGDYLLKNSNFGREQYRAFLESYMRVLKNGGSLVTFLANKSKDMVGNFDDFEITSINSRDGVYELIRK